MIPRHAALDAQKALIIINTHSTLAALRDIAHMKVMGDISVVVEQDSFVSLKPAGAGDPLVGDLDYLGAYGLVESFGVGFIVGAGGPVVAVVVGAARADGEGPDGVRGLIDGVGEEEGAGRAKWIGWLAYHSPGSWPTSEATSLLLAIREEITSVKALASL